MKEGSNWGGVRAGAGRKLKPQVEKKTGRLVLSCSKEEELAVKQAAKEAGKTVSAFMLELFSKR